MPLCPGLPLAGALPGRGPGPLLRPPHLPAEPLGQHLLSLLPGLLLPGEAGRPGSAGLPGECGASSSDGANRTKLWLY